MTTDETCDNKMTNKEDEMSGSDTGTGRDSEQSVIPENRTDMTLDSESEDEGIQTTKKRTKKMIIDDEDSSDNDEDKAGSAMEEGDEEKTPSDDSDAREEKSSNTDKKALKTPVNKKKTVSEVLTEVLTHSDEDEGDGQLMKSDAMDTEDPSHQDSERDTDDEENTQEPVKFNRDLFDAEDSSDENLDIDRAAGSGYDSAEDKDFDESTVDPKLLKKLQKLKGAAKKPRQQKSRKCKPTKDDMLELHSESQRLLRESHVSLPYHKPAPKSLQDFLDRARKKQEVYKVLRGARDIEKAQVIQEKIAETSIVKLPRVRHPLRSSKKSGKRSSALSQESLPDSGHASGDGDLHIQGDNSQPTVSNGDHPASGSTDDCPLSEDTLPDIVDSQPSELRGRQSDSVNRDTVPQGTQNSHGSQLVRDPDSQPVSDGDHVMVEEFDSPPPAEDSQSQSQRIEDVESSQQSERVMDVVPESLETDNFCDTIADANDAGVCDKVPSSSFPESATAESEPAAPPVDISSEENDPRCEELPKSSSTESAEEVDDVKNGADVNASNIDAVSEKTVVNSLQAARQKAVEELAERGVVPALSRGKGQFIILEDNSKDAQEKNPRAKGMKALMDRLLKQHTKKKPKGPSNVEISIVEKAGQEGQEKELKLATVTYCTEGEPDAETESAGQTPGSRLEALKKKLEVGMRKRRTVAYERRQQLYKMENEEGYEEGNVDGLPEQEEEAEMTDQSDTEDEGESDIGEEVEEKDWNNPFLDDEADEEDDDDDAITSRPVCAEINDMGEDDDLFQDTDQLHLKLDLTDDEEEEEPEEVEGNNDEEDSVGFRKSQGRTRKLTISDDENSLEKIPSAQDSAKAWDNTSLGEDEKSSEELQSAQDPTKQFQKPNTVEVKSLDLSFEMTPMTRLLQDTQPSGHFRGTSLTQPVEDSQDLYGGSESDHNTSVASSAMHTSFSDDAVSQILDADGYIRIPTTQPKKSIKSSLLLEGSQDAGAGMDELMGLCSGQFAPGTQKMAPLSGGFEGLFNNSPSQDDRGSMTSLFDSSSQQSQSTLHLDNQDERDNMDDLVGLCSGQFPAADPVSEKSQSDESQVKVKKGVKRRLVNADSSDEEEDESGVGPFQLVSDDEATKDSKKNELSGTDDEKEDGHNSDASELQTSFKGFKNKGAMLRQFVEDEAELSGSEAESDENVDLAEEDDYLEMEAGDNDVTLNNDQLRDQVGRVHMKQMLDDDDRELMRYKEMYLPDGDLHSEGTGRQRRFHWKNMGDEVSQQDMFVDGSDEEKEGGEDPDEKQWRMQRYEREKFLESQQEEVVGDVEDDNSQLMKFGKFFMKRQVSEPIALPQERPPALLRPNSVRTQSLDEKSSPGKFVKPKIPKRGSFLARSKENLAKIAEITKSSSLNVNGTRNSRNFVFSVSSSENGEDGAAEKLLNKAAAAPAVKKRTAHKPPAKKQCVEPTSKPQSQHSIFTHFDK